MKRAMARQAEAERERRAKVINAEGELQASEKLAQAAHIIGAEPAAIQLRYLQTVNEIASENNSTTIFPIPIDLFKVFMDRLAPTGNPPAALPERAAGAGERLPAVQNTGKAKVCWGRISSAGTRWSGSSSAPPSCRPANETSAKGLRRMKSWRSARRSAFPIATSARRCSKSRHGPRPKSRPGHGRGSPVRGPSSRIAWCRVIRRQP